MFFVTRGLPFILELGLLVFCLIDIVQTPPEDCRNLGKVWWITLVIILPLVGGIAWLVAGRPQQSRSAVPGASGTAGYAAPQRARRVVAPDDDPEFLAQLGEVNTEQEHTLSVWEADLKRREEELRRRQEYDLPNGKGKGTGKDDGTGRPPAGGDDVDGDGWVERRP